MNFLVTDLNSSSYHVHCCVSHLKLFILIICSVSKNNPALNGNQFIQKILYENRIFNIFYCKITKRYYWLHWMSNERNDSSSLPFVRNKWPTIGGVFCQSLFGKYTCSVQTSPFPPSSRVLLHYRLHQSMPEWLESNTLFVLLGPLVKVTWHKCISSCIFFTRC